MPPAYQNNSISISKIDNIDDDYDDDDDDMPPPPPPSYPHPEDLHKTASHASSKHVNHAHHLQNDEDNDRNEPDIVARNTPSSTTLADNDNEDGLSYEIPPTGVVHRMTLESDQKQHFWGIHKKKYACGFMLLFLVLIAIILGVGFGTGSFQGNDSPAVTSASAATADSAPPSSPTTTTTSAAPETSSNTPAASETTTTPTVSPMENVNREEAFIQYLSTLLLASSSSSSTSSDNVFQDSQSAQYMAMQWLAHTDPLFLDPTNSNHYPRIQQRFALAAFFYSSMSTSSSNGGGSDGGGDSSSLSTWTNQTYWLLGEDECTWAGISCEGTEKSTRRITNRIRPSFRHPRRHLEETVSDFQQVSSIHLVKNNYIGTLPSELTLLTGLERMHLSQNTIQGNLHSFSWNALSNLKELDLADNVLTGTFHNDNDDASTRLFQSTTLELLDVSRNFNLKGTIPTTISNLIQLQSLDISYTSITGTLPSALGTLSQLVQLKVSNNQVKGTIPPTLFGKLASLMEFDCSDNQLSGSIDGIFGGLGNLSKCFVDNETTAKIQQFILEKLDEA